MDFIQDTPAKRRKTEMGHVRGSQTYNSQDDSGDDLFKEFETVATLPLSKASVSQSKSLERNGPNLPFVTQPTQIINRSTPKLDTTGRKPSIVQVAASSPVRASTATLPTPSRKPGGFLANAMAPLGTAFRPPAGIAKPYTRLPVIDLSDDEGPTYQGGSSDEESQRNRRVNIKPSTFIQKAQKQFGGVGSTNRVQHSSDTGVDRFKEITSNSFYKPLEKDTTTSHGSGLSRTSSDSRHRDEANTISKIFPPTKRSADVMANAYGSSSRPTKQLRQAGPAKAKPVEDVSIDDVEDYQLRSKIKQMQIILGSAYSVMVCRDALIAKKGSMDDAMDLVISKESHPTEIDLTVSDGEQERKQRVIQRKAPAKQQLKAPNRSIREKWTSTQSVPRSTISKPTSPLATPKATEKPRRRLVQGRKKAPSPIVEAPKPPPPASNRQKTPESDDDSDSGVGSEPEDDTELHGKVLNFFNTCSVQDLADISGMSEEIAGVLLSQKPFLNLSEVRQISGEASASTATGRKKPAKRPIGDKIVDKCLEMWTGYEAVDELVARCEALGKPVAEEMKKWGVNVFGAATQGELELTNFDDIMSGGKGEVSPSQRDSGIGTPSSATQSADEEENEIKVSPEPRNGKGAQAFFPQPSITGEGVILKDYQVVGINWLSLLFDRKLSCILADDMGLGKTCQVIAFLAHLLEKGVKGPHVVIVPGSTLENWLREFSIFCPTLSVMPYYANLKERMAVREQIESNLDTINVVVTTYGMARSKEDNKFLRDLKPVVCVYDEGHLLKNAKSTIYNQLMRIPANFRLLLTGTPLQNNLRELASLLGFILPSVFKQHSKDLEYIFDHKARTTDDNHAALLSAQRIARARSMMTPFVLRRKKHQVLKLLPAKARRVEYCELAQSQYEIYTREQEKARKIIADRAVGIKDSKNSKQTANIMMDLRKASIHPLLFRRLYDDQVLAKMSKACLEEEDFQNSDVNLVYEDMEVMTDYELYLLCERYPTTMAKFSLQNDEWMDSGKVSKLCELLTTFKANGDRILVFSQFVMVMDILEAVMETLGMRFFRLDGQTKMEERQDMIDQFYEDEEITVFMLSTKAGGAGINLACANKVIIFDSSFNPQDDIQAENRAHRVGQTREVEVIRLITKGTIEEQIHALGETKLALDDRVAGESPVEEDEKKAEKQGEKAVTEMMFKQLEGEVKDAKDMVVRAKP